jgi:hypothetical protein
MQDKLAKSAQDSQSKSQEMDLAEIFGDRPSPAPEGVDPEKWRAAQVEEQLMTMGRLPQKGNTLDFADLIPAQ